MKKQEKNNLATRADLYDLYNKLNKSFDVKFDKKFAEADKSFDVKFDKKFAEADKSFDVKFDKKFAEADKSFDVKLGKFTDEVLLPAVNDIVSNEIGKHRHEMKNYIDSKLSETKGDIISFIKGDQERDKTWKYKVVDILKRKKIAKPEEAEILANLIR